MVWFYRAQGKANAFFDREVVAKRKKRIVRHAFASGARVSCEHVGIF